MEKPALEATSFCFSPHRPLKSETYRSLIHLLTYCYDHSQLSVPQEPGPETCGLGELASPSTAVPVTSHAEKDLVVNESHKLAGVVDGGFGDPEVVLNEIEDIMQVEENGNLLMHQQTNNYDRGIDQQRMLMDELELIMNGDEILQQQKDSIVSDQQEHVDVQQTVIEKFRSEAELQVDKSGYNLDVPKSYDFSVDRNIDSQFPKPVEDNEEINYKLRTDALEVENELQQKEMEVEKLVHTNGIIAGHDYTAEDREVEEGEISGSFELDGVSVDMIFDDAIEANEDNENKLVSRDVTDMRDFPFNELFSVSNSVSLKAVQYNISGEAVEFKEPVTNEMHCKSRSFSDGTAMLAIEPDRYHSMPGPERNKRKANRDEECNHSVSACLGDSSVHKENLEENVIQNQEITSKEMLDTGICKTKKRSAPSKERKARKKQKERKKRAENNRQLGVRRLKLPLILKPKTVKFCNHYLRGRCQEGEKCRFSHDTVPLTKTTKACCHFARKSCMKGDNCPFDHDLSKYPCENFMTQRFCYRGDDCLFSHKIPANEEVSSAPSTSTPELKPGPHLHSSSLLKQLSTNQLSHTADALSNRREVCSYKNMEHNVAKIVQKPPVLPPKGISCLFPGNTTMLESRKLNQGGGSSPKKRDSCKFANQTRQIASGAMQNRVETPQVIPVLPKGVNFLSFGKTPSTSSESKKIAKVFLNGESGAKPALFKNFGFHENSSSSPCGENRADDGKRFISSSETSNDVLKKTQPATTPQGLNLLSTGKTLTNNIFSNRQASEHSRVSDAIDRSLEKSPNTHDRLQNSSANPWKLTDSFLDHPSDNSAQGYYRSTSNSARKALEFATKIEAKLRVNQSAAGSEVNNATRGSHNSGGVGVGSDNVSAKASKALDFFSGLSSRKKQ